jgi:hypothetical protein
LAEYRDNGTIGKRDAIADTGELSNDPAGLGPGKGKPFAGGRARRQDEFDRAVIDSDMQKDTPRAGAATEADGNIPAIG